LVRVDVPHDIWAAATNLTMATAPVGWDAIPPGIVSLDEGEDWIAGSTSALLLVPSIIVPEEENVLINPSHRDSARIAAKKIRRWIYDPRIS
jgi:RES domain-containing protein